MASSYTTNITLEKPEPGEQSGEWGTTLNANFDKIDTKLAIKDEDNMASNSASHLATQQSIKAYVDSQTTSTLAADDLTAGDSAVTLSTTSGNITIDAQANDADVIIKVDDAGAAVTAVTFDGSDEGNAIFVNDIKLDSDNSVIHFGDDQEVTLSHVHDSGLTLSAGANSTALNLTSTDAGTGLGPTINLVRDSASPAVNDQIGYLNFVGEDAGSAQTNYAQVFAVITDPAEGSEDGKLSFYTITNGSAVLSLDLSGTALTVSNDLKLASDSAVLNFGTNDDVTLTHVHDSGLTFKNTSTGDDTPFVLLMQTGETDIALNDALGKIQFQAPDEAASADSRLVAAEIAAVSEGDFSTISNATKLSFKTAASETATEKMSISSAGNVTMAGDLAVSGGITGATSINGNQIGTRNLIKNGEMRVAQRATSATGIGNGDAGYHVCDRWRFNEAGTIQAEVTMSQDSDVPAGQGFSNSMKLDVTTAESAVAADERFMIDTIIEGQDLTHLKFGTSEAMSLTLSFWIKSTKTGTYCITLYNGSTGIDDRILTKTYTVDSTNTWEKKTLTWVGDTDSGSAFVDDNADGLFVQFWFMAGSNFTDGTLTSSWVDWDDGVWADAMVNALDSTSNYIYLTGVQLEAGSTATEYEHRTFAHELQQCQRYFQTWGRQTTTGIGVGTGNAQNATTAYIFPNTMVDMRATPTITFNGTVNVYDGAAVVTISSIGSMNGDGHGMWMYITTASGLTGKSGAWVYTGTSTSDYLDLSADL